MKKQDNEKSSVNKNEDTVTNSQDQENENLPGYPHYPASEDIMNTPEIRVGIDIENPEAPLILEDANPVEPLNDDILQEGNSADVTSEDLRNLGDTNLSMEMGDDEDLKHRVSAVDMAGSDLIVPGAELDDEQEEIGNEDEENNLYSHSDN